MFDCCGCGLRVESGSPVGTFRGFPLIDRENKPSPVAPIAPFWGKTVPLYFGASTEAHLYLLHACRASHLEPSLP